MSNYSFTPLVTKDVESGIASASCATTAHIQGVVTVSLCGPTVTEWLSADHEAAADSAACCRNERRSRGHHHGPYRHWEKSGLKLFGAVRTCLVRVIHRETKG